MSLETNNIGHKKADQIRTIDLERLPDETVLQFIFRGMAKAALQVAS